ncbi:hypothetical protein [Fundicoccus culcitae]|uniref:Uncharacterized protein n=1 Tax=Fundicoccus culcitae TaxID=2969821 RepID=A0ABY5P5H0_9LACT|nr:hypothetical protein [Fundicoccus culcitae]UUX33794.1 hypothetical protein NRE15_13025 [Fundicoccus culcitae]
MDQLLTIAIYIIVIVYANFVLATTTTELLSDGFKIMWHPINYLGGIIALIALLPGMPDWMLLLGLFLIIQGRVVKGAITKNLNIPRIITLIVFTTLIVVYWAMK